jgi:membrane associated rhomboid family serine protease
MGLINDLNYNFNNLNILQKIIVLMIICFIVPFLINTIFFLFELKQFSLIKLFDISPDFFDLLYKPWSLITYAFFHADLWHLAGNMIILYLSGSIVLDLFGKERFLKIFVLGILFGGLTYLVSYNLFPVFNNTKSSMIGASAGVMAVFIFLSSYNPDLKIRLFFIDVRIIYIAIFLIILDVIQIPSGNSGGHLAHLGGAFIGYFYNNKIAKGEDFADWIIKFYNFLFLKRKNNKLYKKPSQKTYRKSNNQKEIDSILDKISKSGYDSLTKHEKETLFKAGKK